VYRVQVRGRSIRFFKPHLDGRFNSMPCERWVSDELGDRIGHLVLLIFLQTVYVWEQRTDGLAVRVFRVCRGICDRSFELPSDEA
jgi:hypothetical protein